MAKKRLKTQGNGVEGDIEFLFKLYRELNEKVDLNADIACVAEAKVRATLADHGQRIVGLEYVDINGGLSDEELDAMVKEAMAARPWYAKVATWLRQGDNGLAVASIGVSVALVVGVIALFA